jgi:hypothetical protein
LAGVEGGRRDRLAGSVGLKDVLREGGVRELDESPPQTPGAGKVGGVEDKFDGKGMLVGV